MRLNIIRMGMLVFVLGCSPSVGDDGSARRYVEFDGDDLSRMFALLEKRDVQEELKMSAAQTEKAGRIWRASTQEIPGLAELVAGYRKERDLPTSDREQLETSFSADLTRLTDTYRRRELNSVLSSDQMQRLRELEIQMRGAMALVDDAGIALKVQLSDKQMEDMKRGMMQYEPCLKWLIDRYGRLELSARHQNESREDRQKERDALFTVIRGIDREKDSDLLLHLTPDQLKSWKLIQGTSFPISWPPPSISDYPFE